MKYFGSNKNIQTCTLILDWTIAKRSNRQKTTWFFFVGFKNAALNPFQSTHDKRARSATECLLKIREILQMRKNAHECTRGMIHQLERFIILFTCLLWMLFYQRFFRDVYKPTMKIIIWHGFLFEKLCSTGKYSRKNFSSTSFIHTFSFIINDENVLYFSRNFGQVRIFLGSFFFLTRAGRLL